MTRPLVLKFGGTSVADAVAIRRVVAIIAEAVRHRPVVVVVSAMARVTDSLVSACDSARQGDGDSAGTTMRLLRERHLDTIADLFSGQGATRVALSAGIERHLDEVDAVLSSAGVLRELTPRTQDRVLAAGELMSSRIVAAALAAQGRSAGWVDARQAIVTDASHGAATPLASPTAAAVTREIVPLLATGHVVVIGGFIGAGPDGVTTTLGRGGSDYSAAIIGAALEASEIQIWTDVDGMLTADPRVVPAATLVPHLSFGEASELAYFGAKVLHPSTILPAVERNIPVRIMNTMRPEGRGTLITGDQPAADGPLRAIACKRNVTVVDVTSTRMLMAHGFLRRLFEVFERHRTSVDVVTTSEISVSMTLDDDRRIQQIEAELSEFADVRVERGLAIVSAVGDQLRSAPTRAATVVAALEPVPLRMVSQAASRRNVTVVIRDEDVAQAMSLLHTRFFGPGGDDGGVDAAASLTASAAAQAWTSSVPSGSMVLSSQISSHRPA